MIRFNVVGQHLERCDDTIIAGGTIDYLEAKFIFSAEWNGRVKTALFRSGIESYEVVLDENDMITRDKHLNLSEGIWKVNLIGNNPGRITTDVVNLSVAKNGISEGNALPDIPLSYGEQILNKVSATEKIAEELKHIIESAYRGERGEQGPKGEPGDTPIFNVEKKDGVTIITITTGDAEPVTVKLGVDVVDNLLSESSNAALSAAQGKKLNERIDKVHAKMPVYIGPFIIPAGSLTYEIQHDSIHESSSVVTFNFSEESEAIIKKAKRSYPNDLRLEGSITIAFVEPIEEDVTIEYVEVVNLYDNQG